MAVHFHPHAQERMKERGASEEEVAATVEQGERFPPNLAELAFGGILSLNASGVASVMKRSR